MRELTQKFLHKPEQGLIGDCFRTCVACILDLDRDEVPHVFQDVWSDERAAPKAQAALNEWLKPLGVRFIEVPIQATREQLEVYLSHYFTGMHVIIGCNSAHGGHSVVMRDSNYLWDPSIDGSGCKGPMDDGYWWVGILVKET